MKKKVAIVWANPYNKNLGVGALAYSALAFLNDVFKENNIEAEFSFVGSSSNAHDSVIINSKEIPFGNFKGLDFLHWKSRLKLLLLSKKFQSQKIKQFDYVFDIAEGDSFTDIYGAQRFWKILNSKRFFSRFVKKQVLLPQTIGPFKDKVHEEEAFKTMRQLDFVISRDKQSYDYSAKFLPKDKISETIDVAFYMPYEKTHFDNGKINIGINVSGLLWNGGYTRNNQFNMKTDYKSLILDVLSYFNSIENVQIHLVPHVIPTDQPVEDDYSVSEELKLQFPNVIVSPRFKTPIEAKGYISGMDFFTGARMHACIAAFSTGVPVYPMAYSRKFNGLFGETLQYKIMGDCVNSSGKEVFEGLKDAFINRSELKKQISETESNIIKPRLNKLKTIISEIIK